MTEQFRAVLSTYSHRLAFQVLAPAILPMVALCYLMALPLLQNNAERGYLALICPVSLICFTFLGHHLKVQYASFRLRLVPGYALTHLAVTLLLSLIVLLLLAASAAMYTQAAFTITGDLPHVSIAAIVAVEWAMILAAFAAGYFFRPAVLGMLVLMLQIGIMSKPDSQIRLEPPAVLLTLFLDAVSTLALIKRISEIREDKFEYRTKDETLESQQYWWAQYSDGKWLRMFWSRGDKALDRIRRPLPNDFLSQVRHFEAASAAAQYSPVGTTIFLVVIIWVVNFFTGTPSNTNAGAPLEFFTLLPALTVFAGMDHVQRRNLQSLFMLPLDRQQIVSKYGCATLMVLLKNWLYYAAAGLIVAWMPIPGTIQGIPSAAPLLTSLTAQLPIFGFCSLTIGRPRGAVFVMFGVIAALLAFGSDLAPRFLPLAAVIVGAGSIWFSYRRWCKTELL